MKYHHYVVIHAESADFTKRCTKIIKSLILNLIVSDIDTFTVYFNGECWLLQEKASVRHFASTKIPIGTQMFSDEVLTKRINSAAKMEARRDTHYNFIYISDHAKLDEIDKMTEIVDNLENSDTMPNVVYAYENPCDNMCKVFPENEELSFDYIYEQCTKPVRTTRSSKFELSFSSEHKINVRVFKGDNPPKMSHADISVEARVSTTKSCFKFKQNQFQSAVQGIAVNTLVKAGTTNQVKKMKNLYQDKDGVIFKKKDFPKVCNLEDSDDMPDFNFEPQSLRILSFVEKSKLPIYSVEKTASYVTGKCEVFTALHQKCLNREKLIVCSMRSTSASSPELVYLAPKRNMFEVITMANPGMIRNEINSNEITTISDIAQTNPTSQQLKATRSYVEQLPKLNLKELVDPLTSVIVQSYAKENKLDLFVRETQLLQKTTSQEANGVLTVHNVETTKSAPPKKIAKTAISKTDAASIKTAIKDGMIPKVTVAQLKEVCEYYGITPVGKKADLFTQIKNH